MPSRAFIHILNELNNNFSGRNEVVDRLCCYPLLIIDDFGMERGTEYALEQIYNIIDSRYRSRKPLIVTTNLTLDDIRHPQDTAPRPHLRPPAGNVRSRLLHRGQLPQGNNTGKTGTIERTDWMIGT